MIENIYVSPANRGTGTGRQLLDELLALLAADSYQYVTTLVPPDAPAAALYAKAGFAKGEVFAWYDLSLSDNFIQR